MDFVIGYASKEALSNSCANFSEGLDELFYKFMLYLAGRSNNVAFTIIDQISKLLPIALSVAGAILVVNLGWRLFRNFTKG